MYHHVSMYFMQLECIIVVLAVKHLDLETKVKVTLGYEGST